MKKMKLNKKGVSLCEVLVAISIFAIMTLLLATMVAATSKMNIKNYKMNKQMQKQGDIVEKEEVGSVTGSELKDYKIVINGKEFDYQINKYKTGDPTDYSNFKFFD